MSVRGCPGTLPHGAHRSLIACLPCPLPGHAWLSLGFANDHLPLEDADKDGFSGTQVLPLPSCFAVAYFVNKPIVRVLRHAVRTRCPVPGLATQCRLPCAHTNHLDASTRSTCM